MNGLKNKAYIMMPTVPLVNNQKLENKAKQREKLCVRGREERERNFCTKQRDNVSSRLHRLKRVNRERKREKRILFATLIKLLHKQPTLNVLSLVAEVGRANISLRISEKRKISVIEIPIKFCEMGE